MAKAVTIKEEAPFTIGIKNVSSKPVGIRAGRLMNVKIVGVGGVQQNIDFIRKTEFDEEEDKESGLSKVNLMRGSELKVSKEIEILEPG